MSYLYGYKHYITVKSIWLVMGPFKIKNHGKTACEYPF